MYGRCAESSGWSVLSWQNVSFWKQQSVFLLHCVVILPSQSMSMSDFQNTAPVFWHTANDPEPASSSVLYLPLEIWLQPPSFAISCAAVGLPPPVPPLDTVTRSKSGAHPLELENLRVLLPDLRVTVTDLVPTVV